MRRIYPLNCIKYWWAYDIDEVCELYKKYNLHPQTVRGWVKDGLLTMKGKPTLIYGNELFCKAFYIPWHDKLALNAVAHFPATKRKAMYI